MTHRWNSVRGHGEPSRSNDPGKSDGGSDTPGGQREQRPHLGRIKENPRELESPSKVQQFDILRQSIAVPATTPPPVSDNHQILGIIPRTCYDVI